ncbi:MAG: rod shape-determining protein MreD [Anaerolineae bacterium]|nr:rod shape-determining protein MreD [Anaerolineae bacterium]
MTIYLLVPFFAIVGLLQATLIPRLTIWGVFPDIPLLLVVSWGLLRGSRQGLLWGFVAGIVVDLFSGAPFGAATVPLMAVGFMAGLGENLLFRNVLLLLLAIFLATVVYDLLFLFVVQISASPLQAAPLKGISEGSRVEWSGSLVRVIGPSAIVNTVVGLMILGAMRTLDRRFRHQDAGLAGL